MTYSTTKTYQYNWNSFDKELMKDFNWFLQKINTRACIQYGFLNEEYENVDRHGNIDHGLGWDVEYFHPTITLDDRMRFIGTVIAQSPISLFNIVGNTFISHFYGGRGVHYLASGDDNTLVDFDKIADGDSVYKKEIEYNLDVAKKRKQPIWGSTELHTSIQTAARNHCRTKYKKPNKKFHAIDVIEWVSSFRDSGFFDDMMKITHIKDMYALLRKQPGIGEYYGFHGAASSSVLPQVKYNHDQRFVAPGPGAVYLIKRMWPNAPKNLYDESIYFLRENSDAIGLTTNVDFHPDAFNIQTENGPLFSFDQDSLKYYGTEVLSCQFGIYLQIRHSKSMCARRKVARVQNKNTFSNLFSEEK